MRLILRADPYHWVSQAEKYSRENLISSALVDQAKEQVRFRDEFDRLGAFEKGKRVFDLIAAGVLLLVLFPFLVSVAVAIWIESKGPVFYRQPRLGRFGQVFWIFKFRTLNPDADRFQRKTPLEKNIGKDFSTRVGRVLRKYKIDELPQLLNVLSGEMSLVGPRPLSVDESLTTTSRRRIRFAVRPGLTGLWQAHRPNTISGRRRIALDARYVAMRSWGLDLLILSRTFKIVLGGEKAKMNSRGYTFVPRAKRVRFLDVDFDLISQGELVTELSQIAKEDGTHNPPPVYVANHNLHSLYFYKSDTAYRRFFERANLVLIDGTPIVWLGRILGRGLNIRFKNTHLDYIPKLFENLRECHGRVYLLGGTAESNRKAQEYFSSAFSGLNIRGRDGYFDKEAESEKVIKEINDFQPAVLLVCMGMPIQERWLLRFGGALNAKIINTAGGFLDYFSGKAKPTPRWLSPLGMEWLFRFVNDPRRLFFRYFIEPWALLPTVLREILKGYGPARVSAARTLSEAKCNSERDNKAKVA